MDNIQIYEQIEKLTSDIEWRISTGLQQDRFGGEKIDGWFVLAQLRKIQLMIAEGMIGQDVSSGKTSPAGPTMQDKMLEQCADMVAKAVSDLPKYQRKHMPINDFDMPDLLTPPPDESEDDNGDFITEIDEDLDLESMEPDENFPPFEPVLKSVGQTKETDIIWQFGDLKNDKPEKPEKKKDRHNRKDQKPSPKSTGMAGNMLSE